jgi:hypothetical protein
LRYLLTLALLLAAPAWAQITYSPIANGTYQPLHGTTISGPINVRLQSCPPGPWTYRVDGVFRNTEQSCPFDLGGDNFMLSLPAGAHTITATGSTTHTASFTVGGPAPPTDPVATGNVLLGWSAPTACADGALLSECPTLGFEIEQAASAGGPWSPIRTVSPTSTSYLVENLAPGTYFWRLYTITLEDLRSAPSEVASRTVTAPEPPPPTCTAPQPAAETRTNACVAPAVGTWDQTRTYTTAAYPTCWSAGEWLPASAPTGACVVPPPTETWRVADAAAGSRPVFEPVADLAETATVRGTVQGRVDVGVACGQEVFRVGRNSYRYVDERDVALDSPTYRGREHVAICR